jgi:hypothetical protein
LLLLLFFFHNNWGKSKLVLHGITFLSSCSPPWHPQILHSKCLMWNGCRPIFRYFMPLGPRKFCAAPPFVRIQLCVSKNNTKNWQKTKHYSVFSIDLP